MEIPRYSKKRSFARNADCVRLEASRTTLYNAGVAPNDYNFKSHHSRIIEYCTKNPEMALSESQASSLLDNFGTGEEYGS